MEKEKKDMFKVESKQNPGLDNESPLLKYLLRKASEDSGSNLAVSFTDVVEITIKRNDETKEIVKL